MNRYNNRIQTNYRDTNHRSETTSFAIAFLEREGALAPRSEKKVYQTHEKRLSSLRKFSFFTIIFLLSQVIFAEQYVFGGKKGWQEVNVRNGITTGKGRFGYESLVLSSDGKNIAGKTDLLLDFENSSFSDKAGNYDIEKNGLYITKKSKIGKFAAFSRNRNGGLRIQGQDGSFFSSEGPAGSFIIEFWLCPSVVENGEVIMNWRSSKRYMDKIVYQLITISFYQDKLMCTFSNIFEGYEENDGVVTLSGDARLIPGKWSHHFISFEEDTGALSYKEDGILSDIQFITSTGHENGTIYQAVLGVPAGAEICPDYTGLIDNLKITRSYESIGEQLSVYEPGNDIRKKYPKGGGHFETDPIMTKAGTTINSLTADLYTPKETAVQLYIRGGENHFSWTETEPTWIPVRSGEKITGLTGLYFQIAGDLYPSGDGNESPVLTELVLDYTILPEPQPPYKISAEKGDGCVTLSWSYSVDDTAGGYYIYYGTSPGEYLGQFAAEGTSPINAGNATRYTVTGLNNGTIYYFAVSAWSKVDPKISGSLSKEVFARPERAQ